jgi:acyl dehydratase
MTTITLDSAPALPRLYAKAAGGSLKPLTSVSPDALPDLEVVLHGASVSAATLTAYHRLVGGTVTDHVDSVALHGLGFPVALALMSRPEFPLPLMGAVHLSNRATLLRPVEAGQRLTVRAAAQGLEAHHAGTTVTIVTRLFSGEEEVHVSRSVYLAKGVSLTGVQAPSKPERSPLEPPVPTGRWTMPASVGRAWAEVLGDWNPIHLGALPARVLGRKRAMAHGTYLAARALTGATRADTPHEWEITFGAPVSLPGVVSFAREPDGSFLGWDARKGREHFSGSVRPL